ncbi:hypothetical protein GTW46_33485 [Streptomyces sp. SID6013]|nr:hypothetical protein [Streptomyces sp. SID6013]
MAGSSRSEQRIGLLNGIAAYGMWGLVPLFTAPSCCPWRSPGCAGAATTRAPSAT